MNSAFNSPLVCPVVIGRDAPLAALAGAIDALRAGAGRTVLVCGEAGIGKSRLVAEARRHATTAGVRVLQGHCFEQDRSLPYAPWLDLLRARFAAEPAAPGAPELEPLLPDLARVLPEIAAALPGLPPAPAPEPEQERRRLFQAIELAVAGSATAPPALIVLEDLHWSDDTSLELLLHLARRAAAGPLLLIATYRSDEIGGGLRRFLAELDRGRLAAELPLDRLGLGDVHTMLRTMLDPGRPVRADLLNVVFALTEGNPFFIEEVLRSLAAAGALRGAALPIPRSVQDAVQRRSERLSADAHRTAVLAAVIGRRFDFALLQDLTGLAEAPLLDQVKELIAAGLVVELGPDQFGFRHALTRQAIYADLLARERRALHAQIAMAIERLHADALDGHLADLAYHCFEAGAWQQALAYAGRAGEQAQRIYAPAAAVEQFTRALAAAEHLGIPPPPALRRARALAYETLGDFAAALADHEAALQLARASGDRRAEWQAQLDLGMLWSERDYARTGEYVGRALDAARALDDPATIAHSLNRLGNWHMNVDQPERALMYHREALTTFETLADRAGIAATLDLLGISSYVASDLVAGTPYFERALALFRELDDRPGQASSLSLLAMRGAACQVDTMVAGCDTLAEAEIAGQEALAIARAIGRRSAESFAQIHLACICGAQGEFVRALHLGSEAQCIAEEIGHWQWLTYASYALGLVYIDLFAVKEARRWLEQSRQLAHEVRSTHWILNVAGWQAYACALDGDLVAAEAVLAADVPVGTGMSTIGQRTAWCGAAEVTLARGDAARALSLAEQLIATAPNAAPERVVPRLGHLAGRALAALGRSAEAEAALRPALQAALAHGARPLAARCHAALAGLYAASGRREQAERECAAARSLFATLAENVPEGPLREAYRAGAAATLPAARPLTPRRIAREAFAGLTGREREVAALVAGGASNRAIAERLFLTERTVETHVGNILAKLGFSSRAQVAAWAVARGLTAGHRP